MLRTMECDSSWRKKTSFYKLQCIYSFQVRNLTIVLIKKKNNPEWIKMYKMSQSN